MIRVSLVIKHKWSKFFKNPKWNDIVPLLIKALDEGEETIFSINTKGITYERAITYLGEEVVVRFQKFKKFGEEIIRIGTAYVRDN